MKIEKNFFKELEEHSLLKSTLIVKYFGAWSAIISKNYRGKMAYIDLFAGKGEDDQGEISTPIQILEYCTKKEELAKRMYFLLNDMEHATSLKSRIDKIPDIETLNYPILTNYDIGKVSIDNLLPKGIQIPLCVFLDPFGYKVISDLLLRRILIEYRADCILFFNYNRINAAINNSIVEERMRDLFGVDNMNDIREECKSLCGTEKEEFIIREFCKRFTNCGVYIYYYKFKHPKINRTSHYIILFSHHKVAIKIMKDIMYTHSSTFTIDGVGSFSYDKFNDQTSEDYFTTAPIAYLKKDLLIRYTDKILTVKYICDEYTLTPFINKNVKQALKELENENLIIVTPSSQERRKNTMADKCKISFISPSTV
ncbi:MAG: hypothetical protein ATN33_01075 [Epulopiscium sp. Nele67-Bin001]|nr:MAG: hypothetical protein ATN33_01075 [Epulopiscium sp. Nele67-Bin001]